MSEIIKGVPEGVQSPRAKIITLEGVKAKRREAEERHANWLSERDQKPHQIERGVFTAPEKRTPIIETPIDSKNTIIDLQAEREKRLAGSLIKSSEESTVIDEEQRALSEIRTKLARLDIPSPKNNGALENPVGDSVVARRANNLRPNAAPDDDQQPEQEDADIKNQEANNLVVQEEKKETIEEIIGEYLMGIMRKSAETMQRLMESGMK